MIIEYGAKNCFSFKDWLQISFEATRKDVPKEYKIVDTNVLPYLCLEGSNASGKTNALKVLYFIISFARNSFDNKPEEKIAYDTFFNNDDKADFFLTFTLDDYLETNIKYYYEFSLKKGKVFSESLSEKKGSKKAKKIFTRNKSKVEDKYFNTNMGIKFRDNVSFFSTLFQYEIDKSKPFKSYFNKITSNVNYFGSYKLSHENISKIYYDNPNLLKITIEELSRFDLGLVNIVIEKSEDPSIPEEKRYYPVFVHKTEEGTCKLNEYSQSAGTIKLYYILLYFLSLMMNGGLLIMDEIDRELHDEIVSDLLSKFNNANNPKGAQLIFTSHNSRLLDDAKKYRSYFFEKENGESFCYRGDKIPLKIRNERSLAALYNNGDLGGRPNIVKEE